MSRIFHFIPRIMDMSLPVETQLDVRESQREDLLATRAEIDKELKRVDEEIAQLKRKLAPGSKCEPLICRSAKANSITPCAQQMAENTAAA